MYTVTDREQRYCKSCRTCSELTVTPCQTLNADLVIVNFAHSVIGQLQKKGFRPPFRLGVGPDILLQKSLKYVKDDSCVDRLNFVQNVTNGPVAALNLPLEARLHEFWETWDALQAGPKIIKTLKEGYSLTFQI